MPLPTRTAVVAVLLAPLAALWLLPTAASAVPRTPDPERVVVRGAATPRTAADAKAPATVDSDVYAYVISPSFRSYFVVAGHLKLKLKSGSTTKYAGSFTDYSGARTTKASADASKPEAPTISIKARNGSFTFRGDSAFGGAYYSATAVKVPKKSGLKAADLTLAAAPHQLRTATYQVVLTERVGPVAKPFEYSGSMTVAYDANGRVSGGSVTVTDAKGRNVTTAIKSTGYFGPGGYLHTVIKVDKTTMGVSGTFSGTSFSGFGVSGSGSKTTQWVLSGTP